jgi:hypothetical protein
MFKGFSHDFALSWCCMQGVKRVILIGCADFVDGGHFDNKQPFKPSLACITASKNAIENIYSNYLDIYTLNPNSLLNVKRTTEDDIIRIE